MSSRQGTKRGLELQQATPPAKGLAWEQCTPLRTPFRENIKKLKGKKMDKTTAELRDLLLKGQMVGLRALEKKMMNQLRLMREEMLGSVADELLDLIVEKVTPHVVEMVASAISGEEDEGNSPVVQAVIEKVLPQVSDIVESELNKRQNGTAAIHNSADQVVTNGPAEAAASPGQKGFFKTMGIAEANSDEILNMCDR